VGPACEKDLLPNSVLIGGVANTLCRRSPYATTLVSNDKLLNVKFLLIANMREPRESEYICQTVKQPRATVSKSDLVEKMVGSL
jgi:hypothetical protein